MYFSCCSSFNKLIGWWALVRAHHHMLICIHFKHICIWCRVACHIIVHVILIKLDQLKNLLELNMSWKSTGNLLGWICRHPGIDILPVYRWGGWVPAWEIISSQWLGHGGWQTSLRCWSCWPDLICRSQCLLRQVRFIDWTLTCWQVNCVDWTPTGQVHWLNYCL